MHKTRIIYAFGNLKKRMANRFLVITGIFWTFIELSSFASDRINNFTAKNVNFFLLSILAIAIIAIIISLPRMKISKYFDNFDTSINIVIGELIDKEGNIVIASSDYFDTTTSKTDSIKSQLINKYFADAIDHLDNEINKSISAQNLEGELMSTEIKPIGKKIKYSIGDTVDISIPSKKNTKVFISVICEVVYSGISKSKVTDHKKLLFCYDKIWEHIRNTNNKEIHVPVLGSGVAGLGLSKLTLCQFMITSYLIFSKNKKVGKCLNIVIPERNYDPQLFEDLNSFISTIKI